MSDLVRRDLLVQALKNTTLGGLLGEAMRDTIIEAIRALPAAESAARRLAEAVDELDTLECSLPREPSERTCGEDSRLIQARAKRKSALAECRNEPSEWAREKAVDAVYCAEPCPLEPSCDEAPHDDRCRTCLTNDRICFRVAQALDAAKADGRREGAEAAAKWLREDADEAARRGCYWTVESLVAEMIRAIAATESDEPPAQPE